MEVRKYEGRDIEPLSRAASLAFGGSAEEWKEYYDPDENPRISLDHVHVIEEDGEARAGATVLPLEAFVDGEAAPMGGVAAAFAHPAYRRRGYAGKLMRTLLSDMRGRGVHISMLWPFNHSFYRAHGYELAGESIRYEINPREFETSDEQRNVRAFRDGDMPGVVAVFEGRASRHQMCVRRGAKVWERIPERKEWSLVVHERDGGIEGYILFRMTDEDEKRSVKVLNFVAATNEARAGLFSFLASYDPMDNLITYDVPSGSPLHPYLVSSHVEMNIETEFMLRLVDVEGALGHLRRESDSPLVLEVSDDGVPENEGEYTIGSGKVFRGSGAKHRVRLDVRRLAQLYAGYLPARKLAEYGLIHPDSSEALELLERLFPVGDPWVYPTDHF
ncbi:MAG: GNAT family N-acetyltransferase [Rubrobacter sp.]|nr:GNAT family N-acetyltransferase [Rubrobacter sp.]